ncbi:penicillin-binding transpeptidase domain-containing protein [Micavibrio aeruginosavorus]|uniref:penicillin-binding transpeptidase domain-containing protein n=1 Tax=Micavibrio aeruginosavorus TaxID=349221 RepID=UPI003F4AF178
MKYALLFLSLLFFTPSAFAAQGTYDGFLACAVTGSVTVYDAAKDEWFYTDQADADIRTLPASTFKIMNSLIALDQNVTTADEVFAWDGTVRDIPAWNQDTTFSDAFKNSTVWVYEKIATRLSPEIYTQYLTESAYGNGDITHGQNGNFWVYGSFGVSPREQIEMLRKLYADTLPFSTQTMQTVKAFMRHEEHDGRISFGKTGWTRQNGNHVGWWVGYIIGEADAPIFFATRLQKPTDEPLGDFLPCRKSITWDVMDKYVKSTRHTSMR